MKEPGLLADDRKLPDDRLLDRVLSARIDVEPAEYRRATDVTYHGMVWGMRAALKLSEAGAIVGGQSIDLGRRQPRGDRSHAPVDIVAAITGGIHLELRDEVVPPLL